jgi:putative transposase
MEFSESPHRPIHLYMDDAWYFITASTVNHARYLATEEHLGLWQKIFLALSMEFNITLCAWVVLQNHYHILVQPFHGRDIGKFIGRLHGKTSREFNLIGDTPGRKVWYSYWDTCLRGEYDFLARLNYIHYNPVKHGYVERPEDWAFSSYRSYLQTGGEEWLVKCWQDFPITELENDNF